MYDMRASKLTALVAVMVAALMIGSPAAMLGNDGMDPVGEAAAADESRDFIIGVVDMTVSTLNPNTYTMVAEAMIIFPLYSGLMQWDSKAEEIIGDLAKSWWVSPDGLTYEFELVDDAYWVEYDPDTDELTKGPQVTSEDVKWSIDTLAADDGSRLNSLWPDFDGVNIIESTWTNSSTHFGIRITQPFVPYQESLMGNPVFPKYIWEDVDFINFKNLNPVSSGAFYYKTDGLPDEGYARLARNPYWHGETAYGWQLHVDEFVMKRYDDVGTLWSAVNEGTAGTNDGVDAMLGVSPEQFYNTFGDLATPPDNMEGFHQSNGFVYEFNVNQMTDENRQLWGGSYSKGDNNQLLLDPSIKKAIAMCVDRNYIIDHHLLGYGTWTTTLEPIQNVMHHSYGQDGHDCILDEGAVPPATPDPFDPAAARDLLWDAGWRYSDDRLEPYEKDDPAFADVCPLYNAPYTNLDREVLEFGFDTLNTGGLWVPIANDIVEWCRQAGVQLNLALWSVSQLNSIWYAANYDIWLWDWVLSPLNEAVSAVMYLYSTDSIPADSDIYLSDPEIDELYYDALQEMDFETRKELCYDIQDLAYLNRGCQALAFRDDLYAFNKDCWENFGDLDNEYMLLPDIWPNWLCMNMNPVGNAAPTIGDIQVSPTEGEVGVSMDFLAVNVNDDTQDDSELEYRWIWGFGGESETEVGLGGMGASHTFTEDGNYTVTLVAKETATVGGYYDYLSSYKSVRVVVRDSSNSLPHDGVIDVSQEFPTAGEVVTFSGSAVDDEGDMLYYSWAFIDETGVTTSAPGQVVEHQFPDDGPYTVRLLVDDHHYGAVDRPYSLDDLMAVGPNHAPWITVPDYGEITVRTDNEFSIAAGDSDPRDGLVFTWDWGDDTMSVTTTLSANHEYGWRGEYTVTVYADDGTDLAGHNVSDSGNVYVVQEENNIPVITDFYADMDSVYLGQAITFYANASDGDGDPLTFTFEYGDTTTEEVEFAGTGPNDLVECVVEKTYSAAGEYAVYVSVTDGLSLDMSSPVSVTVLSNAAPVIEEFAPAPYWDTDVAMSFNVLADDNDGDTLTYTWDWDDGSAPEEIVGSGSATHTFAESGTYSVGVMVDDGKGLVDYASADVAVNSIPYISPPLSVRSVDEDVVNDYSVSAYDDDSDALTFLWDFGDGTTVLGSTATVSHTYADMGTYQYRVYVWDSFLQYRSTHNVTSYSTVYVGSASVDDPPVVDPIDDIYAVEGEDVTIWAYASDDGGVDELTYTWDFGDGSPQLVDADPPVTHAWASDGDYTLTVWVSDASGVPANTVFVEADVYIENDDPPVADAGGDRTVAEEVSVGFTGEDSYDDPGMEIAGYEWTVNDYDGAYKFYTMVFDYTFEIPGVYSVSLVVEDDIWQLSTPDVIGVTVTDETPPTVDAGDDQTVHNGTTVLFSGSGVDADGLDGELAFSWSFMYNGAPVTRTSESFSFLFGIMDVYTVTLKVTDEAGNYAEDQMTLTVTDTVDPVADAGPNQTVDEGDTVTFDGSLSYDADSSITYSWEFEYDGAPVTPLTGVAPTFVFDIAGVYIVTLTVEDEGGNTASDTVTITVEEVVIVNDPPVADAGDDASITTGTAHTFDGSGSSADVANYTWTFEYDGSSVVRYGAAPVYTFGLAGVYVVELNVTDAEGLYDTDTVTITVTEPAEENEPPVAVADADVTTITVGETVTFDGTGSSDADGTIVTYAWTFEYDGETETLTGATPEFTFDIAGEYVVTLTVTDSDGDTGTDTVTITVEADDTKSFLESYGLWIGLLVVVVIVVAVALMLMKRKGGKSPSSSDSGVDGVDSGQG